jgi:iron complex outermembrane recepter protein
MKKKHILSVAIHAAVIGATGLFIPFSQTVMAQEAAQTVDEVLVTGSRIKRVDLTSNSAISVVTAEALTLSNTVNPEEFLRDDPRFVAATGGNTNNGNDGASTLDLRNLGEARTLVLVDSKRFTPYDYQGYIDLAMIPAALIERVEVITGGASAVYGSDALAGVVNFIMKKDFSGVALDVAGTSTLEHDGKRKDYSLTAGTNLGDGDGNVVANISYTKQDEVTQGARAYSEFQLDSLLEPGGSSNHPNGTVRPGFDIPSLGAGAKKALQFDANGNLGTTVKSFNFNPYNLLLAPQEKYTATILANYKLTDSFELFSRISYANNRVNTIIAPTATFGAPFELNIDNPFLTSAATSAFTELDGVQNGKDQTVNDGIVDFGFGKRLVELGTRDSKYENSTGQVVLGVRGNINDSIDWEVFALSGKTIRSQAFVNDANYSKLLQSMLAVKDSSGKIVCKDQSGGCVPVDYFTPGKITKQMADYIRLDLLEKDYTTQSMFGGSVSGNTPLVIPSASNPIGYAAGFEHRHDTTENRPDQNLIDGNSIGFGPSSSVDSEISITEAFVETRVPLIEGLTGVKSIALESAVRRSNYDNKVNNGVFIENKFNSTSYKFGGEWAVNDAVRFRSMFQRAVRAPTMREIGLPSTSSSGNLDVDYCAEASSKGDKDLVALCEATGVPKGKVGTFNSVISNQVGNFVGGQPDLKPETADTITAGFVLTPDSLPLTLSVDYYDIKIDDAIVQISEQGIMDACYLLDKNPNGFFCSRMIRGASGTLNGGPTTGIDATVVNAGKETAKGVDIAMTYAIDLGTAGSLKLNTDVVRVLESKQQDADILPEYDCAGLFGNICARPEPALRFVQSATWNYGPTTVKLSWQHIGTIKQDAIELRGAPYEDYAVNTIPQYDYFDLYANYQVLENLTLRAGITNLLNKQPPVVGNEWGGTAQNSGNTLPATYDPLGRSAFIGANLHF